MCFGIPSKPASTASTSLQYVHPSESINHWASSQGVQLLGGQIVAKYQQSDSSKFGAVHTHGFNVKSAKLASLFAHMS